MGALARSTYAEGNTNNEHYTAESWKPFKDAYEASQAFMAKVNDDKFTNADSVYKSNDEAKVYADALNELMPALKLLLPRQTQVHLLLLFRSLNHIIQTYLPKQHITLR